MKNIINNLGLYTTHQIEDIVKSMQNEITINKNIAINKDKEIEEMKDKINNLCLNILGQSKALFILTKEEYRYMLKDEVQAYHLYTMMQDIGNIKSFFIDKENTINIIEIKIEHFVIKDNLPYIAMRIIAYEPSTKDIKGWLDFDITKNVCEIETIEILEKYKRKGIGGYMMRILEEIAKGFRVDTIKAWLSPADKDKRYEQIPFYQSCGYEIMFNGKKDYTVDDTKNNGWAIKTISQERRDNE